MRAISAVIGLALLSGALPAAGATAVTTAAARIVSPMHMSVALPATLAAGSSVAEGVRFATDRPTAISFGVRFDRPEMGRIEAPRIRTESAGAGGLVTTQDVRIVLSDSVSAAGSEIRPTPAAHVLVTCHTN